MAEEGSPAELSTPIGVMRVTVNSQSALTRVHFVGEMPDSTAGQPPRAQSADGVMAQLAAYFRGELRRFDVPLALDGTAFQQDVWRALCGIPYGETRSYGDIARLLGGSVSARAVGRAAATNPAAVVVPCHRVVGADGRLTGYAGGLERKAWLLALEQGQHRLFD
jgi:methylated-DNA-[protein]-cysteine S-methyltransferase